MHSAFNSYINILKHEDFFKSFFHNLKQPKLNIEIVKTIFYTRMHIRLISERFIKFSENLFLYAKYDSHKHDYSLSKHSRLKSQYGIDACLFTR